MLLVEDSEPVRKLIAAILETIGYRVHSMESALKALSFVSQSGLPIDLLITDVVMPGMNGPELKEKIELIRPGIKVLFMSGYTADTIAHKGMIKEGLHFIQKPFTIAGYCAQNPRNRHRDRALETGNRKCFWTFGPAWTMWAEAFARIV